MTSLKRKFITWVISTDKSKVLLTRNSHKNCPMFKTPQPLFSIDVEIFPLPRPGTSIFKRPQTPFPTSPNDNQSIKRKQNPMMNITCYQVVPPGRLSFDFFSFSWSFTIYFFVALYFSWYFIFLVLIIILQSTYIICTKSKQKQN